MKRFTNLMKNILKLLVVASLTAMASVSAEPVNKKCPVSGKDVDPAITAKHSVVLGFCCEKCVAKYKKDPNAEAYVASLKEASAKPVNTVCPVSGKEVDPEMLVANEDKIIGFCCEKCVAKFKADPKSIMAKVKADSPGNSKCPVSGKEIDPETALVHTSEVGFCCEKCQTKFKKDPVAVLTEAKKK